MSVNIAKSVQGFGAAIVGLGLAFGPVARAQTPEAPQVPPRFSEARLGQTIFRGTNVSVIPAMERWGREINPTGEITGAEFLQLARPMDRATFERMSNATPPAPGEAPRDFDRLYADYLKNLTRQALAVLWLSRVIDRESMRYGAPATASTSRVYFVMRSVLVENALTRKLVPEGADPVQWLRAQSEASLYAALRESVGSRNVRFNVDWEYARGGLDGLKRHLRLSETEWPRVTLAFPRLPETVQEFERQIRERLQPTHLQMTRNSTWARLSREFEQARQRRTLLRIARGDSAAELRKLYDAVKDSAFRVQDLTASIDEVAASGPKAAEFTARLATLHEERQKALMKELFGDGNGAASGPEETARVRERIVALRKQLPAELIAAARAEFSAAEAAGELKLSIDAPALTLAGGATLPSGDHVTARRARAVFNPVFEAVSVLPRTELAGAGGEVRTVFLREMIAGESRVLPPQDERVRDLLARRSEARQRASVDRELAHELFRYNPFRVETDTCADPAWPCLEADARAAAETLFPERLLPGESLSGGRTSTLGAPADLGKVAEIGTDLFSRALQAPNAVRD